MFWPNVITFITKIQILARGCTARCGFILINTESTCLKKKGQQMYVLRLRFIFSLINVRKGISVIFHIISAWENNFDPSLF